MGVSKLKEKLLRLPSTHGVFSKIRAVFSATQAVVDESEHALYLTASAPFDEVEAYQLEAERVRAQAQEMAQRIRQRPV